ncbi:MAG TPA: hypothetical protein VGN16_20585 [Acidobacteriaceae bacterium]
MSSATLLPEYGVAAAQRAPVRWIISQREDLTWFIGSSLVAYLALALLVSGFPILPVQLVWFFLVDGPHVSSTVTRTYFDKAERQRLGWYLWLPVPLLLIGPAMAIAGQASLFFLLAAIWQQFHVVKQHFGFVMLYKAKNKERDRKDFLLDRWFLLTSLFVPLGMFVMRTQPVLDRFAPLHGLLAAVLCAYGALAAAWLFRQIQKLRHGGLMNWPKLGLLAAVVPLQWIALLNASHHGPKGIMLAAIPLGLFHGLQYHRLIWFHNRNRYLQPGAEERNGMAVQLARSVGAYLVVAIGFNFLLAFLPIVLFPSEAIQAAVWGFAFTHYLMDAKIWHVRSDKGLAAALQMG